MPIMVLNRSDNVFIEVMQKRYAIRAIVLNDEPHMRDAMADSFTEIYPNCEVIFDRRDLTLIAEKIADSCLVPEMLAALEDAYAALNAVPRFLVGDTDSYKIASKVRAAIAKAKGEA